MMGFMGRNLAGRVVLVTGASSGIGAATALLAAEAGMRVVLVARRAERLEAVVEQIASQGGQALAVPADVGELDQVQAAVEQARERFGGIDAVVAAAGYGFSVAATSVDADAHRRLFQTNYFGSIHVAAAVEPMMRQRGSGHLIFISSIAGKTALPYYGPYAATKAAQSALARSMRLELGPAGIDVSVVYPIGTRTEFFEVSAALSGQTDPVGNTPSFMMQSPRRVGRAIMRCLTHPRPEVWPSRMSHLLATLWTMSPRFCDFCFRSHTRRCRESLAQSAVSPDGDGGSSVL
jgi:short-subunit dehydrogenase